MPKQLRTLLLLILSLTVGSAATAQGPGGESEGDFPAASILGLPGEELERMAGLRQANLLELAAVHLPVDPPGDCNHYGWPIATLAGDSLVVMHRRIPGHNPKHAGRPHEAMSYGVVLRSEDGGATWSAPYDLRDCMTPEDRTRGGVVPLSHRFKFDKTNRSTQGYKIHLHAIGTTRDGGVVALNNHGVFRSDDEGRTWKHFSRALREDTFPGRIVNLGPRIIDHPELGLVAFGNWFGTAKGPVKSDQLVVLRSPDGGESWESKAYPAGFQQYEPSALLHDEKFLLVTRDQTTGHDHRQLTWTPGKAPESTATNLNNPRYVDTVDFSFNPLTKRFEVVRSERHDMSLWVWSIAPEDWTSGNWRREYRLLKRQGQFYSTADGFHPAGAVIDAARGVQHVFIYAGDPSGPAGVFRITRSLDTPRIASYLATIDTE